MTRGERTTERLRRRAALEVSRLLGVLDDRAGQKKTERRHVTACMALFAYTDALKAAAATDDE